MMDMASPQEQLRNRTKLFPYRIITLFRSLARSPEAPMTLGGRKKLRKGCKLMPLSPVSITR